MGGGFAGITVHSDARVLNFLILLLWMMEKCR
jgi:hypothetical protein